MVIDESFNQRVNGSIEIAFALKIEDYSAEEPATKTFSTDEHIYLYSAATGPGASSS